MAQFIAFLVIAVGIYVVVCACLLVCTKLLPEEENDDKL